MIEIDNDSLIQKPYSWPSPATIGLVPDKSELVGGDSSSSLILGHCYGCTQWFSRTSVPDNDNTSTLRARQIASNITDTEITVRSCVL